ncbi:MAG: addiction module protein [Candidatus Sumerlaeaceae bacterium]|nr:addiction module protein [Candidatus Sumerlaeaceae bacterium]
MNSQLPRIEKEAIRLPAQDRQTLAQRLLESLEEGPLTEVDAAWVREAEARYRAYKRGGRKGVSVAAALRKARKAIEP